MKLPDIKSEIKRLKNLLIQTQKEDFYCERGYHGSNKGICFYCGSTTIVICKKHKKESLRRVNEQIKEFEKLYIALKRVKLGDQKIILNHIARIN